MLPAKHPVRALAPAEWALRRRLTLQGLKSALQARQLLARRSRGPPTSPALRLELASPVATVMGRCLASLEQAPAFYNASVVSLLPATLATCPLALVPLGRVESPFITTHDHPVA